MWSQTVFFFEMAGVVALIAAGLIVFITMLGLMVGEDPVSWWRGFWR